jgi:hypothetical protein
MGAEGLTPPAGEPLSLDVPARLLRHGACALRIVGESLRDQAPRAVEYRLQVENPAAH